jgi:hypothetical protein
MFRIVEGNHCERCLTPVQDGFYARVCRRFHGNEYLCGPCRMYIDDLIGSRTTEYLLENEGCLFEELEFAEERLNVKIEKPGERTKP